MPFALRNYRDIQNQIHQELVKDKTRLFEYKKEYREKSKTLERFRSEASTLVLDEEKISFHRGELEREVKNLNLVTLADLTASKFSSADENALEEKLLKLR